MPDSLKKVASQTRAKLAHNNVRFRETELRFSPRSGLVLFKGFSLWIFRLPPDLAETRAANSKIA